MRMEPALTISKLGFRRWYERQLFYSFAWLTTCLMCGVVIVAILELVGLRTPGITPYLTLIVLYVVGLMGFHSWLLFARKLTQAQGYANHSTCESCGCYGQYNVLSHTARFVVKCRQCGHEWTIEPPAQLTKKRA